MRAFVSLERPSQTITYSNMNAKQYLTNLIDQLPVPPGGTEDERYRNGLTTIYSIRRAANSDAQLSEGQQVSTFKYVNDVLEGKIHEIMVVLYINSCH